MPVKNLDKYEDKSLWFVLDEDTDKVEYFTSESAAKNYVKKQRIKNYFISSEGKN